MDLTRLAALVALIGLALTVTGLVLLFGAWAMVACGLVLLTVGLVPDWEKAA
jgi:glucose dehydrogenase